MSGGFISWMQSSYQRNRNLRANVQRRKNLDAKGYASTHEQESTEKKPKNKTGRIQFLNESRSERKKIALFMLILILIVFISFIGLIINH